MKYSVVIPVFNVKRYLGECLDSVVAAARRSTADTVEVICVDDGSTDGSGEILDAYAASDLPSSLALRVFHKANGGEGSARNAGLDMATGDWLIFADSDDAVRETLFVDLSQAIAERPDVDLVSYAKTAFDEVIQWNDAEGRTLIDLASEIPDRLVLRSSCEFAYRRNALSDFRFGAYRHGADLVFVSQVLGRAKDCLWMERQEYAYRYRAGSAMHSTVSAADMRNIVAYTVAMFQVLAGTGKRIGPAFAVHRGISWLCSLPKIILAQRRTSDWEQAWTDWVDSLREIELLPFFPSWQKFVARAVVRTRSRQVVRLLCLLPFWFQRKILRRRA